MSVQPNPSGQMDFNSLLPILAMYANRKGGGNSGDLSNIMNPTLGLFSNSYTAPSEMSDEEIVRLYAPQTLAIQGSDDPISTSILEYINRGYPAIQIKRILSDGVYKTGTIDVGDDIEGGLTMYNKLVDDLFAESKTVDEKRYQIQNQDTIFEKAGMRNPNEDYDPTQLFPEVFNPMIDRLASTQKDVDKRMKDIEVAAGDPNVYIQPKVKTDADKAKSELIKQGTALGSGGVPGMLARNVLIGLKNFKDQSGMPLEDQYDSDLNVTASSAGLSPQQVLTGTSPQAQAARRSYQIRRQNTLKEYESKQKKEAPKLDQRATAMNKAAIEYQKELAGGKARDLKVGNTGGAVTEIPSENLRDPVLQQQKLASLVAQKVQEGLRARGETPFNTDMLNRIILNKAMGG